MDWVCRSNFHAKADRGESTGEAAEDLKSTYDKVNSFMVVGENLWWVVIW